MAAKKKEADPVVRIAPLGDLVAYTIWEYELEKLEQGAPVTDLLTIGLCLLSVAATILVTLLSTALTGTTLALFFSGLLVTGIIGAICSYIGWRVRISTRELARQIRARLPLTPVVHQAPQVPPPPTASPPPPATP